MWAADVPAGGAPSAPVRLSRRGVRARDARLALGADGRAAVAWVLGRPNHLQVELVTRAPGGRWSKPLRLAARRGSYTAGDVAVEDDGTAVVAWTRAEPPDYSPRVTLARVRAGSRRVRRSRLAATTERPHLAVSGGSAAVVYSGDVVRLAVGGRTRRVGAGGEADPAIVATTDGVVAAAPLAGGFAVLRVDGDDVSRSFVDDGQAGGSLSLARSGDRVALAYESFDLNASNSRPVVALSDAGGPFTVGELADTGQQPVVAGGGDRLAAIWTAGGGVEAAVAEPGQPFAEARRVSAEGVAANSHPSIGLGADGTGLLAYTARGLYVVRLS